MTPIAAGTVASRLLEPLTHPWAIVAGGAVSLGAFGDGPAAVARIAWRLLQLLLAL